MNLPDLYKLIATAGALTPTEIHARAQKVEPDVKYQAIYARLRYGCKVKAFENVQGKRNLSMYRALPGWQATTFGSAGGLSKDKIRAKILQMRRGTSPVPFKEIAASLGVTTQAAHSMYQRAIAQEMKNNPLEDFPPPDPVSNFRLFADRDTGGN